jgi:hypothetical protein
MPRPVKRRFHPEEARTVVVEKLGKNEHPPKLLIDQATTENLDERSAARMV